MNETGHHASGTLRTEGVRALSAHLRSCTGKLREADETLGFMPGRGEEPEEDERSSSLQGHATAALDHV